MSKLEQITKYIENAKITKHQLEQICYCFAYDFTASATAQKLNVSRQTINSYYKMMREFLIEIQDTTNHINLQKIYCKDSLIIKYLSLNTTIIYYIQHNERVYILDQFDSSLEKIFDLINKQIKNTLITHKKVNAAKILYHSYEEEYFVSTYLHTTNKLEEFITQRLKKFRGLNKNNNKLHIKESIIRYKHDEEFLFKSLYSIFHRRN